MGLPRSGPTEDRAPAERARGSKDELLAGGEQAVLLLADAERCMVVLPERLKQPVLDTRHTSRWCVGRAREVGLDLSMEWSTGGRGTHAGAAGS